MLDLGSRIAARLSDRYTIEREIRLAASLQHANIVPVLSAGEVDGIPHYAMPFVDGPSLRERLAGGQRLPLGESIGILRDIARALAFAHERGVVHRDIKAENVLLSGEAAVVTDFEIAKAIAAAKRENNDGGTTQGTTTALTGTGLSIGTPAYMAPEQIAGDPVPASGIARLRQGLTQRQRTAIIAAAVVVMPPPVFENALRPSSALRALSALASRGTRSLTACGSSTAVYGPAGIDCGLRLATAF
jgi:serine/threonine protein kinase